MAAIGIAQPGLDGQSLRHGIDPGRDRGGRCKIDPAD